MTAIACNGDRRGTMTDSQQKTFDELYEKCRNTIDKYELIPPTIRKVKICYSGGKDSSMLADLLCAYRERERADLTLEVAMLPIPRWCYQPDDPERRQRVADALDFWRERGLAVTTIPLPPSMTEEILETGYGSDVPCWYCSWLFKPWGLMRANFSLTSSMFSVLFASKQISPAASKFLSQNMMPYPGGWVSSCQ